jgi:hypothetical protein
MASGYVFFYFFHNLSPSAPRLHLKRSSWPKSGFLSVWYLP